MAGRLIDADALIDNMEGHVTTMSVCSTTIEARAKGEMKRTCISDVANAPTVDAIPVEWIEWRIAHAEREGFGTVVSMLRTVRDWWNDQRDVWQKEQEAQDVGP